jgi:predicted Zn-dependent protease
MRAFRLLVVLSLLGPLGPFFGCEVNPVTGQHELMLISRSQEISIGEEAAPRFEEQFGGLVADQAVQDYVNGVGRKVAEVSDRPDMPYEYALLSSDVPNAFALPGGKIYITAGLFRRMTNERQLAGVLGHETGHVAAKHNVKNMQRQMGVQVFLEALNQLAGGDEQETAAAAAQMAAGMALMKYSRDDEYQADELGVRYAARSGYNPYGMVELLQVLKDLSESEPGLFDEMFQTHPLTDKRIEAASNIIKEKYPDADPDAPDPTAGHFNRMRQRLIR